MTASREGRRMLGFHPERRYRTMDRTWTVGTAAIAAAIGACAAVGCGQSRSAGRPTASQDPPPDGAGGPGTGGSSDAAGRAAQGGGDSGRAGQAGSDIGSAGSAEIPTITCADPSADRLVGIPVDPELGCLLSGAPPRIVACAGPDNAVSSGIYVSSCVRYVQSGEEFWLTAPWEPELAPGWESCSDLPANPPPPCFARACPENDLGQRPFPESLCTEAETRKLFDCGGVSSRWDDNCCRRPYCTGDADCTDGESCRPVSDPWTWLHLWPYAAPDGTTYCDYGGTPGSPTLKMCMPKLTCVGAHVQGLTCDEVFSSDDCGACVKKACCSEAEDCTSRADCAGRLECVFGPCPDQSQECMAAYCPDCVDAAGDAEFNALDQCAAMNCANECDY
jgi:hypothetical protein